MPRLRLQTEQNTESVRRKVRAAFINSERSPTSDFRQISSDFEHGQWWITYLPTGAQWSAVDAAGRGSVDGFDFEQVTEGTDD